MSTHSRGPDNDPEARPKVTLRTLHRKHQRGEPITMVTAYDFPSARAVDQAGIDCILVGDSLAMVVLGYESTIPVTMDEMLHHARAVRRGARSALLCGDMPFMSYQASASEAVANAGRFLKEAGMEAVKLEGGCSVAETVGAVVRAGIPVLGHVGLTPQSVNALGGYRVQGRDREAARGVLEDALALEDAGCFSIVLESIPERLGAHITARLSIPTIGIGAGAGVCGQVLVYHDLLGYEGLAPRFVKRYADVEATIIDALSGYREEVVAGRFPTAGHTYTMPDEEWEAFLTEERAKARRGQKPWPRREVTGGGAAWEIPRA